MTRAEEIAVIATIKTMITTEYFENPYMDTRAVIDNDWERKLEQLFNDINGGHDNGFQVYNPNTGRFEPK